MLEIKNVDFDKQIIFRLGLLFWTIFQFKMFFFLFYFIWRKKNIFNEAKHLSELGFIL